MLQSGPNDLSLVFRQRAFNGQARGYANSKLIQFVPKKMKGKEKIKKRTHTLQISPK